MEVGIIIIIIIIIIITAVTWTGFDTRWDDGRIEWFAWPTWTLFHLELTNHIFFCDWGCGRHFVELRPSCSLFLLYFLGVYPISCIRIFIKEWGCTYYDSVLYVVRFCSSRWQQVLNVLLFGYLPFLVPPKYGTHVSYPSTKNNEWYHWFYWL